MTSMDLYDVKVCIDFYKLKTEELGNIIKKYEEKNTQNISSEEKNNLAKEFKQIYSQKVNEFLKHINIFISKLKNISDKEEMKSEDKDTISNVLTAYIKTKEKFEQYLLKNE